MVDIKTVIYLLVGIISIGGAVVTFFNMQVRQNMKIEQLENSVKNLKSDLSNQVNHQISTEKAIVLIGEKLDRLIKDIEEIKEKGCGRNC